ncbi:MAG TPA: nitroreductase family protein [Candidatus Eisenbacteria bacterium]|nr:nitroreductase family protein [Candidatus Eisenbacteria bacterium]
MSDRAYPFVPYHVPRRSDEDLVARGRARFEEMNARRSVRSFAPDPVPRACIEWAIRCAGTAPSGAHRQPWRFVAVSNTELKRRIRAAAEEEERVGYEGGRMPPEWLEALAPLGTDWRKGYLETAPWIVVCFREMYGVGEDGAKITNYYISESVGIACGFFIAAIHAMGLATLTHTPSPMQFLSEILEAPENWKPFILFPVGHPAPDARVPDLRRKELEAICRWVE